MNIDRNEIAQRSALIVEDETLVAWHLESVLQDLGFTICEIVSTGSEAIAKAAADRPDVIFMDVNLADDIDGVEAATKIVKNSDIPIIFVTANADDNARIRATLGERIIVGKPATPAAIQRALRRLKSF
jgi:CheY-like chemotaxis protein